MTRPTHYGVAYGKHEDIEVAIAQLESSVRGFMEDGYVPHGSTIHVRVPDFTHDWIDMFIQPMVVIEDEMTEWHNDEVSRLTSLGLDTAEADSGDES